MGAFALLMGALAALRLPETLGPERRVRLPLWQVARLYLDVVRHRRAFGHVATNVVLQTAVMVFVCASPSS